MGVTCGLRPVSMKAETAASSPEMRTAPVTTRFARTPSSRDVVKSIAAARMCSPSDVRVSNSWSSTRQNAAIAIETIAILRISTPPMSHGWFSGPIEEAIVPSWPKASTAMLCIRNATAKVATSITAGECVRSGRKTSQSISVESASTTAKQSRIPAHAGQPQTEAYAIA